MPRFQLLKQFDNQYPYGNFETHLDPSSSVFFGHRILNHLPTHISNLNPDRVFIVCDSTIEDLYSRTIRKLLKAFSTIVLSFADGEKNKNLSIVEDLANRAMEAGVTKSSLILTLGGGLSMNIGGMLAGLLYRGIKLAHVPTNFIGQTDVCLSNKQGVNTFGGKNLLGFYKAPEFSLVDTKFLESESKRHILAGMVESFKNALILNSDFYQEIESYFKDESKNQSLHLLAMHSFEQKLDICKRDPTEKKLGLSLEYGHTIGHALEILSNGKLLHGEAVYIGMKIAADIAKELKIMSKKDHIAHQNFLNIHPMKYRIPKEIRLQDILETLKKDNKKIGDKTGFILLSRPGHLHLMGEKIQTIVPDEIISNCIQPYLAK